MKQLIITFVCVFSMPFISNSRRLQTRNTDDYYQTFATKMYDDPDAELKKDIEACQPFDPPVPSYDSRKLRISQIKCIETVWNIKVRALKYARNIECFQEVLKKKGESPPGSGGGAVGGRDARQGEYPHMAAVGWKSSNGSSWIFKCGGILVNDKYVLTAAHCSRTRDSDTEVADVIPKIVRFGDINVSGQQQSYFKTTQDSMIKRIIQHPNYKSPKKYNDIALIELEYPVKFLYNIHPACLWTGQNVSILGEEASVTGWGVVDPERQTTSAILQSALVNFIDQGQCDSLLKPLACNRNWCGLHSGQLCAGQLKGGVDACQGDSGGPLQVRMRLPFETGEAMHYVVGVTSFGIGCAKPNTPGVYTRVSSYIGWIEQIVWGDDG